MFNRTKILLSNNLPSSTNTLLVPHHPRGLILEISSNSCTCKHLSNQLLLYFAPLEVDSNNLTLIRFKPRQIESRERERKRKIFFVFTLGSIVIDTQATKRRRNTQVYTVWRTKLNWNANRDTTRAYVAVRIVTSCAGGLPTLLRPGSPSVFLSCHWCAI